jgi:hypothetical protein
MSDDSDSDIMEPNRAVQKGYTMFNVRTGVSNDDWSAELYIDNLTNRRAEISNTFVFDRQRLGRRETKNSWLKIQEKLLNFISLHKKGVYTPFFIYLS